MKKLIHAFIIGLSLIHLASAQTGVASPQPASAQDEPQTPATQSPELAEANRLSLSVVKLYGEGKYDEALPLARQALEIREKTLGPTHLSVAAALANLAELYIAKHKHSEAETHYQRVLGIYEKSLGANNVKTATVVDSLALLQYLKGNFSKAEALYQRGLSLREAAFGQEHLEVARSVYLLAEFYRSRAEYEKAEPLFLRTIAINDKVLSPKEPEFSRAIERYVCFLYESKSHKEASQLEKSFRRARRPPKDALPSPEVVNGKATRLPKPAYPEEAITLRAGGIVRVEVKIDEEGKVIDAKVLCGHPIFARPSAKAAYAARFSPTKVSGQPVKVTGIIVYRFVAR